MVPTVIVSLYFDGWIPKLIGLSISLALSVLGGMTAISVKGKNGSGGGETSFRSRTRSWFAHASSITAIGIQAGGCGLRGCSVHGL